ncbi:unnamed protein product [Linum tenue]|uniref:Uncharacterized protein n=1 Tax=Linum tenue TaxID=586396 RepID=A0AAV0ISJ5_9ROSI|nr:unnamed protein product [Linum tenue]
MTLRWTLSNFRDSIGIATMVFSFPEEGIILPITVQNNSTRCSKDPM